MEDGHSNGNACVRGENNEKIDDGTLAVVSPAFLVTVVEQPDSPNTQYQYFSHFKEYFLVLLLCGTLIIHTVLYLNLVVVFN